MKQYISFFALIITTTINSMDVKVPTVQELRKCLIESRLEHFAESKQAEKLMQRFADKVTRPELLTMPTTLAILEYAQENESPVLNTVTQMMKPAIYSCFVNHSPKALKELKNKGFIE